MELGLFIGGSDVRKRDEAGAAASCGEHGSKRRVCRGEWAEEMEGHSPVQLELKLAWPAHLGCKYQAGPSSSPAAMATTAAASVTALGGGSAANGPSKAGDRDNYNDVGPSSSTSRSTTPGGASGWRCSDEEGGGGSGPAPRKKLRLTKEQSCYLEESFKEHATLNPKQKLVIAKKLNLRPRQVEVWFQNRRARTKLKQTEVEYEYMKRCCESLTEENRRLHREIQELRALKSPAPHLRLHLPATTLSMCPSCERAAAREMGGRKGGSSFATPLKLRSGTLKWLTQSAEPAW